MNRKHINMNSDKRKKKKLEKDCEREKNINT